MSEKEPGILDTIISLLGDTTEGDYKCEQCEGEGAFILAKCKCGWKIEACMICVSRDATNSVPRQIKKHIRDCDELEE